jgi:hypothetical protein
VPLVLYEPDRPSASLATALAISDVLESELHIVRLLSAFDGINPLAPSIDQLLRAVDHRLDMEHATRVWLGNAVGYKIAEERLKLRYGDPVDEIAAHACALEAVSQLCTAHERRLRDASRGLDTPAGVAISNELSSAEAILREARMHDRGLIVWSACVHAADWTDGSTVAWPRAWLATRRAPCSTPLAPIH